MFVTRWGFDISKWNPSNDEWKEYLGKLKPCESERISKFRFPSDAKLSLAGRCLIHKYIKQYAVELCIDTNDRICDLLDRTSKGKPYLKRDKDTNSDFFLDFNVSTAGDFVIFCGIAGNMNDSCPAIIGCDIMKIEIRGKDKSLTNFFSSLSSCYTQLEWNDIKDKNTNDQLHRFYETWTLKESYIKAIGIGLGMELQRMEFHSSNNLVKDPNIAYTSVSLKLDGKEKTSWKFEQHCIDINHVVTIAYGPVDECEEEYKKVQFQNLPKSLTFPNQTPNIIPDKFIILKQLE